MRGKKIISLALVLSLVMSLSAIQISYAEEAAEEAVLMYQDEINFLKSIEVIDDDFDGSAKLTKGELAKMTVSLLHPDIDYSFPAKDAVYIFNDVAASHPYYSYIKACKDLKIINGDNNGNFNPDSTVSVMDAITIMSNALGYTLYADAMGGYPSGYYQIAYQTGLLDGMTNALAAETTGDVMAKILYNALFADLSGVSSISSDGITVSLDENKNLLAERLGIYEYDATVYDNGISALEGSSIGDPERVIIKDNKTNKLYSAYVNGTEIGSYLGYRVKAYIRNNQQAARNEIVHVNLHKKVKTISMPLGAIVFASGSYVEYEEDENALDYKKVDFGSIRPILIFNGVRINDKGLEEIVKPENYNDGMITFIDNNGDNKYDVADLLSFNYDRAKNNYNVPARNIVVDTVLTINGQKNISCMLNPANSLDLADEDILYSFTGISAKKSIYELSTYDVISIAEAPGLVDGKTFYFLTVGQEMVSGTVDGIVDGNKLDVNGNAYAVSSGLTAVKSRYINNLKLGSEIYLCLDITGKIAYSVSTEYGSKNYAYLINMKENLVPENYLTLKLFTKDGEIKSYEVSQKVKIDGVSCPTVASQITAISKRDENGTKETFDTSVARPIIFEENSNGQITLIDTDVPNLAVTNRSDLYATHTTIPYDNEEVSDDKTLKAGFRGLRTTDYKRSGSFEGKFYITGETVILAVPDIDTYGMQETVNFITGTTRPLYAAKGSDQIVSQKAVELNELEKVNANYKVMKVGDLSQTFRYDLQGYDIDEDTGVAGLVVLRGRNDIISEMADERSTINPMYVFLKTTEIYDAEKEKNITKVYYTKDGQEELSATIDLDEAYFPYKYLLRGCAANFTQYNVEVKALRPGDLIRVTTSGTELTHIERVYAIAKDFKSYYSNFYYPGNATYFYTDTPVSKSRADHDSNRDGKYEDYSMPFDVRDYRTTTGTSVHLLFAPVKAVNGNTISFMTAYMATAPATTDPDLGEVSTIDITDPSTYILQYINAGTTITTIDVSEDGQSVKVKAGSTADIKTVTETGNIDTASMVLIKSSYYNADEIFIINNLNKIPAGEKWWVEN